mgnify:CR=1 FL=1
MSYCSVEDLRKEVFTEDDYSDERLSELIKTSCDFIDRITGQFFELRELTLRFDGRDGQYLVLPYPLIEATEILVDNEAVKDFVLYNRLEDRVYPRIYRKRKWLKGVLNISVSGSWGYVDENLQTPASIKRIAIKLAMYHFPALSDSDAQEQLNINGRVISETTDGHSYSLANVDTSSLITGDKEIDDVLKFYMRSNFRMAVC